jgi:uncharacterized Zn finger protein
MNQETCSHEEKVIKEETALTVILVCTECGKEFEFYSGE